MSATTQPNSPSLHAHPHACAALAEALFNDPFYQAVTIDHAANTVRRLQVLADLHSAWYLSIPGVHTAARGHRLAQRLLAPTLAKADQAGASCFLETFNPLSVPFYSRLGFTRSVECVEPITGSTYWLLVRGAAVLGR